MAPKAQAGLSEEAAIQALKSRTPEARRALLQKMDPATKTRVLAKLQQASGGPKSDPADLTVLDPRYDAKKKDQQRATAADYVLDQLPTVAGTAASVLGGTKKLPTGMAAAAAGGVLGEDIRQVLGEHLYHDPNRKAALTNQTGKEAAEKLAIAGAEQSGAEMAGRGITGAAEKIAEKTGLKAAAASAAAAKSGHGVQMTPGEASGNTAQKFLEHFMNYLPGAMGPMGKFEHMRSEQIADVIGGELDKISAQKLTREQAGDAAKKVIETMEEAATQKGGAAYNAMKKPLGLAENATREEIETAAKKAAQPHASGITDASGKPIMKPGDGGKALRDLKAADKAFGAAQDDVKAKILDRIANSERTEAVHTWIAQSPLKEIRTLLPKLPDQTRASLARAVMEDAMNVGRNPVTGAFNAKAALGELAKLDKDGPKSALLFGNRAEAVRSALQDIAKIQREHAPGGGMAGHRVLAGILTALGTAGVGLASGHTAETMLAMGGEMAAARVISGVITNPETSLKALTVLRRLAAGGTRVGAPMIADFIRGESLPESTPISGKDVMNSRPTADFLQR